MSVIKNLINGILSFLGGIVGFFTGFLNPKEPQKNQSLPKARKGSGGYFLELDEASSLKASSNNQAAKAEPAKAESKQSEPAKAEPVKAKMAEATSAPKAVALAEPPKAEPKADSKTAEPAKAESETEKIEPAKTARPPVVSTAPTPAPKTFAPDFLAPNGSSNSRRRPGPNMNYFLDMARQVKPAK